MDDDPQFHHVPPIAYTPDPKGFALSGKIMLSAIIILFFVVVLMMVLHLYARWYLLRQRRRQILLRRNRLNNNPRRAHIVFYVDNDSPTSLLPADPANRGLEPEVFNSLPVFVYSSKSKTLPEGLECAVCLSEFEDDERGRLLPRCNHSFHTECIDMWFHSHSTCPICRAVVEPVLEPEGSSVVEPGSSSGLCSSCQHEEGDSSATSLGSRRKGLDLAAVRIQVPGRNELENELPLSSPASLGFRSPGTRLLSLKRILSMSRKTPTGTAPTTPCGAGTSCSSGAAELDLESGPAELNRVLTPR